MTLVNVFSIYFSLVDMHIVIRFTRAASFGSCSAIEPPTSLNLLLLA